MKRIVAIGLVLLFFGSMIGAQGQAQGNLVIQCNIRGAQVYINGRIMGQTTPNLQTKVPVGTWPIKITAKGYQEYNSTITVTNTGLVLPVTMVLLGAVAPAPAPAPAPTASLYPLTVKAPGPIGRVFINGVERGPTPLTIQVAPGTYEVKVLAGGMLPWTQQVQVINGPVTVTAGMQTQTFSLQVNAANAPGAAIFLNGSQVGQGGYNAALPPGTYTVIVRAAGFLDYTETFNLQGPKTINASLQQQTFTLQVSAGNAPGAAILLNGAQVGQGSYNAALQPGTYTVVVRAPGFVDYTETFNLAGPKVINAALQAQSFSLQVSVANPSGAAIFLNGAQVGQGSYNAALQPGTYTVIARAPGFNDYTETFNLQGPKTIAVSLQQVLASFTLTIPPAFLQPDPKGNPHNQIQVFVDNVRINVSPAGTYAGSIPPGKHQIRIVGGGLKFEQNVDLQAGKAWVIEPSFGLILR